eukprot:TRINITY_DN1018_c0_g1_i2.p1 TRINITY_DN1018_c0_g1~~TRINITY_DN1018_c0_g1_i2.p1  ORF type:complete len:283 (+),score=76.42 TRINITY_DN1018_c0_g1_i2:138-986(+)
MVILLLAIASVAAASSLEMPQELNNGRSLQFFLESSIFKLPEGQNASRLSNTLNNGNATSVNADAAGSANINGATFAGNFYLYPSASDNVVTGGGGTASSGAGGNLGTILDFVRMETSANNNVATAGNGTATNGVRVNVGNVDNGTFALDADSSGNIADATGGSALNGNLITVAQGTPGSNIGIDSSTDGNTGTVSGLTQPAQITTGSIIALGNLDVENLFIKTNDANNQVDTTEAALGAGGSYVDLGNSQAANPIVVDVTSSGNTVRAPLGSLAGARINFG